MIILGVVIVLVLAIGGGKLVFSLRYHERKWNWKVNIVAFFTHDFCCFTDITLEEESISEGNFSAFTPKKVLVAKIIVYMKISILVHFKVQKLSIS